MSPVVELLRAIGERLMDFGGRMAIDRIVLGEVLGHIAKSLLEERAIDQTRSEILALFEFPDKQLPHLIDEIAKEVGGNRPEKVHAIGAFLDQIPHHFRKMIIQGYSPKQTVEQIVVVHNPESLARFFPVRVPRFRLNESPGTLGGWVLIRMLGQGGFGEVWLARHSDFHATQAAFKFCLGTQDQNRLLRHEAKVLNQVMQEQHHGGIVKLLDAKLDGNPPWLKYEYVPGGELGSLVHEWSHLPFATRLENINRVISELAEIVGYFHALTPAVIHRDLKPSNILVERDRKNSAHWRLRIADFGIGNFSVKTALDRERMITSLSLAAQVQRAHTPLYASPQQRLWKAPDPRDDIYALGMIWYQLLCDDLFAPVPMGNWFAEFENQGAKREYLELIDSCIADDVDDRPANGNELYEKLKRFTANQTTVLVTTPPISLDPVDSNQFVLQEDEEPNWNSEPRLNLASITSSSEETKDQQNPLYSDMYPNWEDIIDDIHQYEIARLSGAKEIESFLSARIGTRLSRWKDGSKKGIAPALHLIAECYDKGIGFTKNKEKAQACFQTAARKGYIPSLKVDPPAKRPEEPRERCQAERDHLDAANRGDRLAQFNLGWAFMEGRGAPHDDKKAVEWYLKSANQGYDLAQYNMGWMYMEGRGVPRDDKKAIEWYQKAAAQNYERALYNMGWMIEEGRGAPKDDRKAFEWYLKAADQGYDRAQYSVGLMYQKGRGTPQNDRKAVEWYQRAADQGYANAQFSLGWMYMEGRGVVLDDAKAIEWYLKAANQGFTDAEYNMGWMYMEGRGVPQDYLQAIEWYRKAAKKGYPDAEYNMGWMYMEGRGVEQDDALAVDWYRKAAQRGYMLAQYNLGWMYMYGRGVPQDDKKAIEWYLKAAAQNHKLAQHNLGWMYSLGRGVPKDELKAIEWYQKAADQGYADAQRNLNEIRKRLKL